MIRGPKFNHFENKTGKPFSGLKMLLDNHDEVFNSTTSKG